jgi:MFS transporter, ACS family, D-galactonate transporter
MGNLRWIIAFLLGLGILISSADRITLSVTGDALQHDFGLNKAGFGLLTGAFSITYALCQIPIGLLLDRFGVRLVGRVATFSWGVACLFSALAPTVPCLFIARGALGVAECSGFPRSAKAIGYWFPMHERSTATAIFETMVKTANVVAVPLEAFIVIRYGWRSAFILNAIVSFAYFIIYFFLYHDPSKHPMLSSTERAYIVQGGSQPEGAGTSVSGRDRLKRFLRQPKVWGLTIGFSSYGYGFGMLSAWLPTYLESTFRISLMQAAFYSTIPWIVATACGFLIGGRLVDTLIRRGHSKTGVRKGVMSAGLLLGTSFIGASITHDIRFSLFCLALAMGGLAFHGTAAWTIPGLIAPKGQSATIGGIMNMFMNFTGFIAQVLTGFIVHWTGSFTPAFVIAGTVPIIGIISYLTLLGKIEELPDIPVVHASKA